MINGRTIRALRHEDTKRIPIDWPKYFTSLSLSCTNAAFGENITRKIIFRSKEEYDKK